MTPDILEAQDAPDVVRTEELAHEPVLHLGVDVFERGLGDGIEVLQDRLVRPDNGSVEHLSAEMHHADPVLEPLGAVGGEGEVDGRVLVDVMETVVLRAVDDLALELRELYLSVYRVLDEHPLHVDRLVPPFIQAGGGPVVCLSFPRERGHGCWGSPTYRVDGTALFIHLPNRSDGVPWLWIQALVDLWVGDFDMDDSILPPWWL